VKVKLMSSDTESVNHRAAYDPFPGQDYGVVPPRAKGTNMLDGIQDVITHGKDAVGEAADKLSSKASDITSSVQEHAVDLTHAVGDRGAAAGSSAAQFFYDNPLAVGILAFLVGAAIGIAIPRTDAENQVMGGAREKLMEEAKGAVNDIKHSAKDAASGVVDSVRDEIKSKLT
jgi:ElaB/YqjD/DUF883 family membrane-anchored ribosome-binding protein/uncharacterized protein YjbJ (UPF0337 family)